jgi:ArsR family transcriptional regulator, arsenate/arsenite/antimonite-responsive transcriptional repressor
MPGRKDIAEQTAADALAALGNRTRLRIFKLLVRAGPEGANISTLQGLLRIPPTTLAHHVASLAQANLMRQERRGREVICTANYKALFGVLEYVKDECCAGLEFADDEAA